MEGSRGAVERGGRPVAPLEIKRSKIALGEVIIDGGVVPAGGLRTVRD